MSENTRVKISSVVKNQLPDFIRADFPLAGDFLAQYYTAIENQGSTLDILQNIDEYIKVDELVNLVDSTTLSGYVGITDNVIDVESTTGFPDTYGLIQINDEIITYTGITTNSFTGCSRGFSGITSYRSLNKPDELVFSQSGIATHSSGTSVSNLSIRFLQQFFKKVKKQITPGFEERPLSADVDKRLFVKQSKDFYSSKGTDQSFEILFRALYGKDVEVIKPSDYLFIPSDAEYKVSKQLVVESIDGDPMDLINRNIFQDPVYGFEKANGAISDIEKIVRGDKAYYRLSLDYDQSLDKVSGDFSIHPNTKLVDGVSVGSTVLTVDSTVGFGTTGVLIANYIDGSSSTINYTSKSLTQFYGVTGITATILDGTNIGIDTCAYGQSTLDQSKRIKVRINQVIDKLEYPEEVHYYNTGDTGKISALGRKSRNFKTNNWFYNNYVKYNVKSVTLVDASDQTWDILLYVDHSYKVGDSVTITGQDGADNITLHCVASDDVAVDVGAADHDVLTITNAAVGTRIQVINAAGGSAEKWHAYIASMSTVDAAIA